MIALARVVFRRLVARGRSRSPVFARVVIAVAMLRWVAARFRRTDALVLDPRSSYEILVDSGRNEKSTRRKGGRPAW